jgi:hypothetical protein
MASRHFGVVLFGGSLQRLLAGLRYGAELLGFEPALVVADVPRGFLGRSPLRTRGVWRGLMTWGQSLFGIARRRHRTPNSMYLEFLEQRQLLSAFQISGGRDASDAHLFHLALSTDSPSMESWSIQWNDGTQPQTLAGNAQIADHSYTSLTDPIITATAADGEGVHVVGLVPESTLGSLGLARGRYSFVFETASDGSVSLGWTNATDSSFIGTVSAWTQTQSEVPAADGDGRMYVCATVATPGDTELLLTPLAQLQPTPSGDGSLSVSRCGDMGRTAILNEAALESTVASGYVMQEIWEVAGDDVSDLTGLQSYQYGIPDATNNLGSLEFGDIFTEYGSGSQVQGYITAPESGDYTFWLAADDSAQLCLSAGVDLESMPLVAAIDAGNSTGYEEFLEGNSSGAQYGTIHLDQGQLYRFLVLQKNVGSYEGAGHMAVAWTYAIDGGGGITVPEVIPGDYLTAFWGCMGSWLAAPTGFSAQVNGATQITLHWYESFMYTSSFWLRRFGPDGLEMETYADNYYGSGYTDTGLVPGTSYWYTVQAVAPDGEVSDTAVVSATTEELSVSWQPLPTVYSVDAKGTFLCADTCDTVTDPRIIDLSSLQVHPGDWLNLERRGAWAAGSGWADNQSCLVGVFSSSTALGIQASHFRVSGAIDAGEDLYTGPTFNGYLPTDIPEDFLIQWPLSVQVPAGARYLFVGTLDSHYGDNSDPNGDLAIVVTPAAVNLDIDEGGIFSGSLVVNAPYTADQIDIDWDDGMTTEGSGTGVKSHTYTEAGIYHISVSVRDEQGTHTFEDTAVVVAHATSPTLDVSGADTVEEDSVYWLNLAASGPDADTISAWTIDWADGNIQTVVGNPARVPHRYLDGPSAFEIAASATYSGGSLTASNTVPVSVTDTGTQIWPYYPSTMNAAGMKLNGDGTLTDGVLRLTGGSAGQSASAYGLQRLDTTSFTTDFTFQVAQAGSGDGLAFVIENQDSSTETPTAYSIVNGGMGFAGLNDTLALAFNPTTQAVALYAESTPGGGDWHALPEGLDLFSGDPLAAHLVYDSGTLTLTLTDAFDASRSFKSSWVVNIPSTVGDDVGYMGFTAAGNSAIQDILSWTYQPLQHSERLTVASQVTSAVVDSTSLELRALNVSASNVRGGTDVTYEWLVSDNAPGLVYFDDYDSLSANQAVATFSSAGTYTLYAKLTDSTGASVLSNPMTVTLTPDLTSIAISSADPAPTIVGGHQHFTAVGYDQFGDRLATQPTFTWSETGDGYSIDAATGTLTLGTLTGGAQGYQVVASANGGAVISSPLYFSQVPRVAHIEAYLDESMTVASLNAHGTDVGGGSDLNYSWTLESGDAAAVSLWDNASADTAAYFTSAGTYGFRVTVSHDGQSANAIVTVHVPQFLTAIYLRPVDGVPGPGGTQHFSTVAVDQFGHPLAIQPTFSWNLTGSNFTLANGMLTAPSEPGSYQLSVNAGGLTSDVLSFTQLLPLTVNPSATVNADTHTSVALNVLGSNPGGSEADLTYAWSVVGPNAAYVSFSDNRDNSAKHTTATFYSAGTYEFLVVITNASGLTTTAPMQVTVEQSLTTITLATNDSAPTASGAHQVFTAQTYDQFGMPMTLPSSLSWTVSDTNYTITGSGTVGTLTAGTTLGSYHVTAGSNTLTSAPLYFNVTPEVAVAPGYTLDNTSTGALLSVLGTDVHGGSAMTYTWTVTSANSAQVTLLDNGDHTAAQTTAYFASAGNYTLEVTISDGTTTLPGGTLTFTVPQVLTSILARPLMADDATITFGTQHFSATAFDQFGNPLDDQPASFNWTVVGNGNAYSIDSYGLLTTEATAGSYIVTARATNAAGTTVISEPLEFNQGVSVTSTAFATLYTGDTAGSLTVAASVVGDGTLTYTWTTTDNSPAGVTFSSNGNSDSAHPVVTFSLAGTYTFLVAITDADGNSSTSLTNSVTVDPCITSASVTALTPLMNNTQQFMATAFDQFGNPMPGKPVFIWAIGGIYFSATDGTWTATINSSSPYTITANANGTSVCGSLTLSPSFDLTSASASAHTSGSYATLSAVANDDLGGADLTYTWSVIAGNPDAVWFADNGDHSAATTQAYFAASGNYTFQLTVVDANGTSRTSTTENVAIRSVLTSIDISTIDPVPQLNGNQQFTANSYNQFGQLSSAQPSFTWGDPGSPYEMPSPGYLTLPSPVMSVGSYTVAVTATGIDNSGGSFTLAGAIAQDALAPVFTGSIATSTGLDNTSLLISAPAADMSGTADLTYSWFAADGDPGFVDFSSNASTPALAIATFYSAGAYHLSVTVSNSAGLSVTSNPVDVVVTQATTSLHFTSDNPPIFPNDSQSFAVEVDDQFGVAMQTPPAITWTLNGTCNSITFNGTLATATAGAQLGLFTVTAFCVTDTGTIYADADLAIQARGRMPALADQSLTVDENSSVSFNILTNATDVDAIPYAIGLSTEPTHGIVTIDANGTALYTPNYSSTESDCFWVQVINHDGSMALEYVDVTVAETQNYSGSSSSGANSSSESSGLFDVSGGSGNWTMAEYEESPTSLVFSGTSSSGFLSLGSGYVQVTCTRDSSVTVTVSVSDTTLIVSPSSDDFPINLLVGDYGAASAILWPNSSVHDGLQLWSDVPYDQDITFHGMLTLNHVPGVSGTIVAGGIFGSSLDGNFNGNITVDGNINSLEIDGNLTGTVTSGEYVTICLNGVSNADISGDAGVYIYNSPTGNMRPRSPCGIYGRIRSGHGRVWAGSDGNIAANIYGATGFQAIANHGNVSGKFTSDQGYDSQVIAGGSIAGTITAASGSIFRVQAGGSIDAVISADSIGTVTASGSISGSIIATSGIACVWAGLDVTAGVSSADGYVNVHAGRDLQLPSPSDSEWLFLDAGHDITSAVSARGISAIHAGHDILAPVTAQHHIGSVSAGHAILANITAGTAYASGSEQALADGGLGSVIVGGWFLDNPYFPTAAGVIGPITISATGDIGLVAAVAALGFDSRIAGTTITAGGDIGTISASAGINAHASAHGSIFAINPAVATAGRYATPDDLAGSFTAGGNLPDITCQANITASLTATGNIGSLSASQSITGTILATGNIATVTALIGDISGNITSKSGSIGNLFAGHNLSGNMSAHNSIGSVIVHGAMSGYVASAVSAVGPIWVSGNITNYLLSNWGSLTIRCGSDVSGSVSAMNNVVVLAKGNVTGAIVTALGDLEVSAGGNLASGTIIALGTINLAADGDLSAPIVQSTYDSISERAGGSLTTSATAGSSVNLEACAIQAHVCANNVNETISSGGGACFAAGTRVLLADGTARAVEKLEEDLLNLAVPDNDPEAAPVARRIVRVYRNPPAPIFEVQVQGHTVRTTAQHPFYVLRRGWVAAVDLVPGDQLRTASGEHIAVEATRQTDDFAPVYNFQVERDHTFFVMLGDTAQAVLVHNDCGQEYEGHWSGDPNAPLCDEIPGDAPYPKLSNYGKAVEWSRDGLVGGIVYNDGVSEAAFNQAWATAYYANLAQQRAQAVALRQFEGAQFRTEAEAELRIFIENVNAGRHPSGTASMVYNTAGGGNVAALAYIAVGAQIGVAVLKDAEIIAAIINPIGIDNLLGRVAGKLIGMGCKALWRAGKYILTDAKGVEIVAEDAVKLISKAKTAVAAEEIIAQIAKQEGKTLRCFKDFPALKKGLGQPAGTVWHHLVEKRDALVEKFGAEAIHNNVNVVAVAPSINSKINGFYSSLQPFSNGQLVRYWLESKSWLEQYEFGKKILDQALAGRPLGL